MSELDQQMREVLLALAMTSNGGTASFDAAGTTEPDYALVDDAGRGKLLVGDAPHLHYAGLYDQAENDGERRQVLEWAKEALQHIRVSSGDRLKTESKAERDERIVKEQQGVEANQVAIWARCSVGDVHRARAAAGKDPEYGRAPKVAATRRNREILKLFGEGMSARAIAAHLGCGYNTVRRTLGRSA